MSLSERWLKFCKPYIDKLMKWAQRDTDISLAEYEELKKEYNRLYK